MRASPSREKRGDFTDVRAEEHEESTGATAVKSKRGSDADGIQATMAADGRRAGNSAPSNAFGMGVDQ